jgi:hypothetical protein
MEKDDVDSEGDDDCKEGMRIIGLETDAADRERER